LSNVVRVVPQQNVLNEWGAATEFSGAAKSRWLKESELSQPLLVGGLKTGKTAFATEAKFTAATPQTVKARSTTPANNVRPLNLSLGAFHMPSFPPQYDQQAILQGDWT
jgi:uncharacterized protein YfaA (DUF2138 family)